MLWRDFLQDYAIMNARMVFKCSPLFQQSLKAFEDLDTFFLTMVEKAHIYEGKSYQSILDDYLQTILEFPPLTPFYIDYSHFRRFHGEDITPDIIEVVIQYLLEKGAVLRSDWILAPDACLQSGQEKTNLLDNLLQYLWSSEFESKSESILTPDACYNYNVKGYLIDVFASYIPELQDISWDKVGRFSYDCLYQFLGYQRQKPEDNIHLSSQEYLSLFHPNAIRATDLQEFVHLSILTANSLLLTRYYLNAN
jgi:hypothetical protein